MCEATDSSKGKEGEGGMMPKVEILDCDSSSSSSSDEDTYSGHTGDNVATSSGSNVRSSLIGMGFKPSQVDQAIDKNGDDNIEVLLEALFSYPADQKPNSEDSFNDYSRRGVTDATRTMVPFHRSNSSTCLLDDKNGGGSSSTNPHVKEEPDIDISAGVGDEKKASLLMMSFSSDEIEFAIDKLGEDAPINELVDFILAARFAANCERNENENENGNENDTNKECDPEALFGTMEKTLRLLEMGFSENEISAAIDRHGSNVPIQVLADSIVAYQSSGGDNVYTFPFNVKTEESEYENFGLPENGRGKRPQDGYTYEPSIYKKPKQEYDDYSSTFINPTSMEARNIKRTPPAISRRAPAPAPASSSRGHSRAMNLNQDIKPTFSTTNSRKALDPSVGEPPYVFYGDVRNLSYDVWGKISQFLYEIEPEFVNARLFSALNRQEGYVHNLPTQDRFHVHPKPPTTIEEAIPQLSKWWPLWDTRKQLTGISSESSTTSQICDRLGRTLNASRALTSEQQRDLLDQCEVLNLVWVGQKRLAPLEPEHLERILGYPPHHTRVSGFGSTERLQLLENSFQVDTLAYHLSVLRPLYRGGLTLLSINSGIGGAEIALTKLDIYLKGVVSVESSEVKRKILKQWWEKTEKTGNLVQIEGIERVSSTRLESLIKRFGGFDLVICQNPSPGDSSTSKPKPALDNCVNFDFTTFHEFVRIVKRVRNA